MIKKFLLRLVNSEVPLRKSNWTDAMEKTDGFADFSRKEIIDDAKEELKQEQEQLRQQIGKTEDKPQNKND